MNYREQNKAAWEEAFQHRYPNWGEDNYLRLLNEDFPFLTSDILKELRQIDFKGKTIAQFCCNNGRELMSIMKFGAACGVGFDIAENILEQARQTAEKAGINCSFEACDILSIDEQYKQRFDFICVTAGALTWFEDLNPFFHKVFECLKDGGILFINEIHPVMNMLPLPGDDCFDDDRLNQIQFTYFKKEPWIENNGMSYMSVPYLSKTFCSFSHPFGEIINAIVGNGMAVQKVREFEYDIAFGAFYNNKGIPLSYILIAQK